MRQGTLIDEGDIATLVFVRVLPHTAEHVWEAISTPEGLSAWAYATDVEIDGRTGGTIAMRSGPPGYRSTGKILAWDPPRVFEYEWNVAPTPPEMPDGMRAIFRYELAPEGSNTRLTVTYRRIAKDVASGFLPGLHVFLDRLEAQLARTPLPDWDAAFAEARALYPAWSHAPAAGQ